ncbi:thiamine/thiamine pyrophosphate ABC transporter permease ThiP [Vibrio sp. SCSIO 43137]|uniref:thiamine/thiamine pyrophosphate ABC transporter permease ThiP n=1 Tax=Vibrio sp. SCSIO 43137 TaxID=3021011 RepID=UPI0023075FC1|nr:thiamine/thiamine pyrophosphate ABC transporter permease ThiP [Vibrio sp. SCSIO 43137]WCE31294.1 thiamine/thiamine pyrophosphate ABC transporter permease ThiP [Vibrio sp. SCSIO 43137]
MQRIPKSGFVVAAAILLFVISALSALLLYTPEVRFSQYWNDGYYRHVTYFSFYQASLSMLISVSLAIPVAHALSRRQFFAKAFLLKVFSITLVLPVLVGVFGLLAIYGNSGLVAELFQWLERELPFSIYGLNGILLAHVFFNLPYASRLLYQSLETIPEQQHKLCAHLGMSHWDKFRLVEWPRLRQQLPHVCGLVFMLCFTSFATVMALGGGPKSTTIELAIYQAIKFDFDLQAGAVLALWQMLLCALLSFSIQRMAKHTPLISQRCDNPLAVTKDSRRARLWDGFWIVSAVILVIPPLIMVVISGLNSSLFAVLSDREFWLSVRASFAIALMAAVLALMAGVAIINSSRSLRMAEKGRMADSIELSGAIILVTPGLVISVGLFLLLRDMGDVFQLAGVIVVLVNALMALPYVIKTLSQPMLHIAQQYQLLSASLGMKGFSRFRLIDWRALHKPMAHAFAISFMLSIGDISAIALFGSQDFKTLPLYLFQLLGSYQMDAAAVVSLTLLLLSLSCFALIERFFRRS